MKRTIKILKYIQQYNELSLSSKSLLSIFIYFLVSIIDQQIRFDCHSPINFTRCECDHRAHTVPLECAALFSVNLTVGIVGCVECV